MHILGGKVLALGLTTVRGCLTDSGGHDVQQSAVGGKNKRNPSMAARESVEGEREVNESDNDAVVIARDDAEEC